MTVLIHFPHFRILGGGGNKFYFKTLSLKHARLLSNLLKYCSYLWETDKKVPTKIKQYFQKPIWNLTKKRNVCQNTASLLIFLSIVSSSTHPFPATELSNMQIYLSPHPQKKNFKKIRHRCQNTKIHGTYRSRCLKWISFIICCQRYETSLKWWEHVCSTQGVGLNLYSHHFDSLTELVLIYMVINERRSYHSRSELRLWITHGLLPLLAYKRIWINNYKLLF